MALRRRRTGYLQGLLAPIAGDITGALCLTCGRIVDSESMVEGEPGKTTGCAVLVKHHGQEELRHFSFDSVEWDYRDLGRMMQGARFFDPTVQPESTVVTVPW